MYSLAESKTYLTLLEVKTKKGKNLYIIIWYIHPSSGHLIFNSKMQEINKQHDSIAPMALM